MVETLKFIFLEYSLFVSGLVFIAAAISISEFGSMLVGSVLYLIGDGIYLIYAILINNTFGYISLGVAIILGARTIYKMHKGVYHKKLNKKDIINYKI